MSQGNQPTRLQELIQTVPLVTLAVTALNVICFAISTVSSVQLSSFTIAALPVIYESQWYRLITSAFLHANFMHIMMNMFSFYYMGMSLVSFHDTPACERLLTQLQERYFGSCLFLLQLIVFVISAGLLYVATCFVLAFYVSHDLSWLNYHSVGFSGVLFALATQESFIAPSDTRSIFGFIQVPTRWYPWALLIALQVCCCLYVPINLTMPVLQILMPNVSFLGHLCGLLMGLAYMTRLLTWAFPSPKSILYLEQQGVLRSMKVAAPGYVPCPERDGTVGMTGSVSDAFKQLLTCGYELIRPVIDCVKPLFSRSTSYQRVPTSELDDSAV